MSDDSIYNDVGGAEAFEKGQYFKPGQYEIEILECKHTTGGYKGDFLIVECLVHEADSKDEDAPAAGTKAAYMMGLTKNRDMALANFKKFMCDVLECKQDDHSEAKWSEIMKSIILKNKLAGKRFHLHAFTNAKSTWTNHVFSASKIAA